MRQLVYPPGYLSLLALMSTAVDSDGDAQKLKTAMDQAKVVPDVLPKAPQNLLQVLYGTVKVNLGNILTPSETAKAPKVFWNGEDSFFYTVCMIDPDAPSRTNPRAREWEHWLVVNIPGNKVDNGDVLCTYNGPTPPAETGLHRYVIVVYQQPGKMNFNEPEINNGGKRSKFSVAKFAAKYNLGDPIAANFFQAKA